MSTNKVYVWGSGEYDRTRWVSVGYRGTESCVLQLTDLCLPGQVSRLSSVSCPANYLKTALDQGALQVTLSNGHLLLQRDGELIHLEFRGRDEASAVKANFLAADLISLVALVEEDATKFAMSL